MADDSLEFSNYIPVAVFLAEENLFKRLDSEIVTSTVSVRCTSEFNRLYKPDNHRFTLDLYYRTSSQEYKFPTMKTNDFIRDYWRAPDKVSTSAYPFGQPKYYGNDSDGQWILAPTPASSYNFTIKYGKQIEHLSAANQSNDFMVYAPDALFYATMVGMAEFAKMYETLPIWQQRYADAIDNANNQFRRDRRDDSLKPGNPKGGQNTLTGDV
jgi:hypothetical protein